MFRFLLLYLSFSAFSNAVCQEPVDILVANINVKAGGEEVFYYGFAKGDKLIFNLRTEKGKELKEVEVLEYPSSTKFKEFKTSSIQDHVINIGRDCIYKFRIANSSLSRRICEVKIQRVPASNASVDFNTSVEWRDVIDTTYVSIGEKYVKKDSSFQIVLDRVTKVSSRTALNGNPDRMVIEFPLPEGTSVWSYYIGVGNESKEAYAEVDRKFTDLFSTLAFRVPGYGPLIALGLKNMNLFEDVQSGDNVKYYFIPDLHNVELFTSKSTFNQYKQGDIISEASQMKLPLYGYVYLGLLNDNIRDAIEVIVKVTAIVVTEKDASRTIQKMFISNKTEPFLKN